MPKTNNTKTLTNNSDYTPDNVNNMGINQLATVLNAIVQQATGETPLTPTDESSFISVAQTALLAGYDPLAQGISQVLSKTIFSMRPYNAKFGSISVDNQRYGNHVRKLQTIDKEFENDDRLTLKDGESIDMYKVNKPKTVQTNFYGANQYQKSLTIYRDQLDTAFSSSAEFAQFLSMVMQNASDQIEQGKEETRRATVNNMIGATLLSGNNYQIVDVLKAYNDFAGTQLNATTIFNPDNFPNFVRWFYSFVQIESDYLTERTSIYHAKIGSETIMRHTPKNEQRLLLYSPIVRNMESIVTSTTYHDEKTVFPPYEAVSFWQAISDPMKVSVTPAIVDSEGKATTGEGVSANVIGMLFDREALGETTVNEWSANTPFNARGGYYNQYWHFTERFWNDFSENCIVFVLPDGE